MKRLLALVAILLTTTALGAGCGDNSDHNAQDVTFAKDMVPHHEEAVMMSDMALAQAGDPRVKALATRIKAAQGPEIATMTGWLTSWGEKPTDMGSMDMPGGPMNGMMSDTDMKALGAASGAEFDRLYLQGMTAHHRGAVGMAKVEVDKGRFGPARALAREIITGQEKELAEMAQLLTAL